MSKYGETITQVREEKYLLEALKEMGYQIEAQPEAAPLNCCYSDQEAKARPFSSGRIHCPAPSLNFHGTEFA